MATDIKDDALMYTVSIRDRGNPEATERYIMTAPMSTLLAIRVIEYKEGALRVLRELDEGAEFAEVYHNGRGPLASFVNIVRRAADKPLCVPLSIPREFPTNPLRLYEGAAFVRVKMPPDVPEVYIFDGRLLEIASDQDEYIWVHCCYADSFPPQCVQVGDGRSPGYTRDGNRIVSVPAKWCTFYSAEDAENIERAEAADQELLGHAIG